MCRSVYRLQRAVPRTLSKATDDRDLFGQTENTVRALGRQVRVRPGRDASGVAVDRYEREVKRHADARFEDRIPLPELFKRFDRETRLVLVGDAYMYPGELTDRYGAIDITERNELPGAVYLQRVRDHFWHCAWLNPMERGTWAAPSIRHIRRIFPMYPMTVAGVDELARDLARG